MELLHKAIIVHVPVPGRSDYIFFDSSRGTLSVRFHRKNKRWHLYRGALVHYTARNMGDWYSCEYIEIIDTPRQWVIDNIGFLHHLLELIDFFIPRDHHAENVFMMTMVIYQPLMENIDIFFLQNFLLCKFFIIVGMYPEPRQEEDRELLHMLVSDSDWSFLQQKYVFLEKKMIQWLRECIDLHPYAGHLKTKLWSIGQQYEKNNNSV